MKYRDLNKIRIKNRYLFLLIGEILDRFSGVAVYAKLDLKNTYYKIRIRKKDEWKTIFRTKYNYFEYKMMLFDFINASAIFQTYINKALADLININYITYFNNIVRKLPDIPRELPKHVDRAIYPGGMLRILS
jgi:hypothetical protein